MQTVGAGPAESPRQALGTIIAAALLAAACNLGHDAPRLKLGDPTSTSHADPESTDVALDASPPSASSSHGITDFDAEPSMTSDAGSPSVPTDAQTAITSSADETASEESTSNDSQESTVHDAHIPACSEGAYRCVDEASPIREKCEAGTWLAAQSCASGQVCVTSNAFATACSVPPSTCDSGTCNGDESCELGAVTCESGQGSVDTVVTCTEGKPRRTECLEAAPHCVANEGCRECRNSGDCQQTPPDCFEYVCSEQFACEARQLSKGADCPEGVCDDSGQCVQCLTAQGCGEPDTCRELTCEQGQCVSSLSPPRSACDSETGVVCNAEGDCVQCIVEVDCPGEQDSCLRPTCSAAGLCGTEPLDAGQECAFDGGQVCDGAGACVECVPAGDQCGNTGLCRASQCIDAVQEVGWFGDSAFDLDVYSAYVYLRRLPVLGYQAELLSFGVLGVTLGGQARLGLYGGNAAGPIGAPIAEAVTTLDAGPQIVLVGDDSSVPIVLGAEDYYWLSLLVSDNLKLQVVSDGPAISPATGFVVEAGAFGDNALVFTEGDYSSAADVDALGVFIKVQWSE